LSDKLTAASWDLAPHTAAKLNILSKYLKAWFPIIVGQSQRFDRVIYIDGFAGPGRYKEGEDGSPMIALKAAIGAINEQIRKPFEFHFVERRRRAATALMANIEDLRQRVPGPENIHVYVHREKLLQDAYEQRIRARLQAFSECGDFCSVDPFGWTGMPMSVLSDLMNRPSTEILVNFMFEEINRFIRRSLWMRGMASGWVQDWRRAQKVHRRSLPRSAKSARRCPLCALL
jgi:three-Cys-motif partner protein